MEATSKSFNSRMPSRGEVTAEVPRTTKWLSIRETIGGMTSEETTEKMTEGIKGEVAEMTGEIAAGSKVLGVTGVRLNRCLKLT